MKGKKSNPEASFKSSDPEAFCALDRAVAKVKQRQVERGEVIVTAEGDIANVSDLVQDILPEIKAMGARVNARIEEARRSYWNEFGKQPDRRPCPTHKGEFEPGDWDATFQKSWAATKFVMAYGECQLCKHERLVNERHGKWIRLGVPRRVAHATFDNYQADTPPKREARDAIRRQAEKGRGFVIMLGNPGNGKSHLAAAMMKTKDYGFFITHADLSDLLRQTYDGVGKKTHLIDKYRKAPVLILDEVDQNVKGDDIVLLLYSILAFRYDNDLLTGLTTNHDMGTLMKLVGPRLEDRMAQHYTSAIFTWESYRRQHREI